MSSTYGENLKLSIFGQSHGPAIGITLDGIPAGLPVDLEKLQQFLNRRAPGQNDWSTPRKEDDRPEFLAGLLDGYTCGAPIAAVIHNKNTRSRDYSNLKDCPRPGHADYTAQVKYGGYQDVAGGGHFSGRLTAPLCIAGGLCKQWLEAEGIQIGAHILAIGEYGDLYFDPMDPELETVGRDFPVLDPEAGISMRAFIAQARAAGDSVGGIIECAITGLPAGLGDPMFGGMENRIAQIVFGIPAVKGVDFGIGFDCACVPGSQSNDDFAIVDGQVVTQTNNAGGIQGGITNGMPIIFTAAIKATPSIAVKQQSISLSRMENADLEIKGRHDPCIVPRAVPVVEAAAAIAVYDAVLARRREIGGR
ncbi:MAG: chorismate synthase [Oscillospiraceae bacterium]|nr:chorismate synthase [Oscillospiraceae bacterium]